MFTQYDTFSLSLKMQLILERWAGYKGQAGQRNHEKIHKKSRSWIMESWIQAGQARGLEGTFLPLYILTNTVHINIPIVYTAYTHSSLHLMLSY